MISGIVIFWDAAIKKTNEAFLQPLQWYAKNQVPPSLNFEFAMHFSKVKLLRAVITNYLNEMGAITNDAKPESEGLFMEYNKEILKKSRKSLFQNQRT